MLFEPQASSFHFRNEKIAGRRAILRGIFASFVARQKMALAAAIAPIATEILL